MSCPQNPNGNSETMALLNRKADTFSGYYDYNQSAWQTAIKDIEALVKSALDKGGFNIALITSRLKGKESCIEKSIRKYYPKNKISSIADLTTDLFGIRVLCLFENEINGVQNFLMQEFDCTDRSNKIDEMDKTESEFGYRAAHLNLKLKPE